MTFTIHISPSGENFEALTNTTILESAITANINLPFGCKDGSCGSCKCKLITGQVQYQESVSSLSEEEVSQGIILPCVSIAKSDIEIEMQYFRELDNISPKITPCKVQKISFPASDLALLTLKFPPNAGFHFLPGQFIELSWRNVTRSYSIANASIKENGLELLVRKVANGVFSELIFNELKTNTLMRIQGPYGTFFVRDTDAPIIFVAGGTGIAPIKAMLEKLISDKTNRPMYLYWGVSDINHIYTDKFEILQNSYKKLCYTPVFSGNEESWKGKAGLVHNAVVHDFEDLSSFEVYVCGSNNMIEVSKETFLEKGLSKKNFFADVFASSN